jgi:hypothetical protein
MESPQLGATVATVSIAYLDRRKSSGGDEGPRWDGCESWITRWDEESLRGRAWEMHFSILHPKITILIQKLSREAAILSGHEMDNEQLDVLCRKGTGPIISLFECPHQVYFLGPSRSIQGWLTD